ncbi:MAG: M2 family metallopeptidase [Bacteroidetes bacterium]|nr:M2 family metallopeptidase [Bacteroidota bacterium]MBU1719967.1 M2 family metallopeptidase [Bacteroidota bacterium]
MKSFLKVNALIMSALLIGGCGNNTENNTNMEAQLASFIARHDSIVQPMYQEVALAEFEAAVSGKDEDYQRAAEGQLKYSTVYTNKEDFALLKKIKESNLVKDELLARQLEVLYSAYLSNQIDSAMLEEMINLQSKISSKNNTYRAVINGDSLTNNQLEATLVSSTDSKKLEETWKATKQVGVVLSDDILALVKLRNKVAKSLGFNNYHEMSLQLSDQDPAEIEKIFNELDNLTRDAFRNLKGEIDTYLATRYGVKPAELMPWHYQNQFFQEAPKIYNTDLDKYYKDQDLVKLTEEYYKGIGLPVDDIMANSDLFEKPGKNQHAFCINIDTKGDIRVLCNVKPNYKWMNTMLHEFGHGVYDKYISNDLPFSLHHPAHTFTTEAIAMLFGRFASSPQWIQDMTGIDEIEKMKIEDECVKTLRMEQLVFSRWAQVMYRFEKALYEDPDQDLNALWWTLVSKYQLLTKPEGRNAPDWASKIHIATSPCYYHNYLLGELLASQLYYYILEKVIKVDPSIPQSFKNNAAVGKYLKENIFAPGARYLWDNMIEKATGEKLTAKYYARQFVG